MSTGKHVLHLFFFEVYKNNPDKKNKLMQESSIALTKDNYQEHDDLSIFPVNQLVKIFTSIPKISTLNILRDFNQSFILKFLEDALSTYRYNGNQV